LVRIRRVRSLDGQPAIAETIAVPQLLFPDLADIREVPNTLYDLYERRYGVTIARAVERLSAVAADERDAKLLGIAPGAPLLETRRMARQPVPDRNPPLPGGVGLTACADV
jgi:GntR family transcriptional regulator